MQQLDLFGKSDSENSDKKTSSESKDSKADNTLTDVRVTKTMIENEKNISGDGALKTSEDGFMKPSEDGVMKSADHEPDTDHVMPVSPESDGVLKPQPSRRGRKSYKETDIDVALLDVPDEESLKQKHYYSISEVAEWFHVNTSLLRFWEKEFDVLKPRKNRKGDRLFRPEDVKNLRIIYYLLRQQKFSIEGARQYLKDNRKKAESQVQIAETLIKFRSFLLELKSNLGA